MNAAGAAVYIDNNKVGTAVQNETTGGWQNWVTGSPIQFHLAEGQHSLKASIYANRHEHQLVPSPVFARGC